MALHEQIATMDEQQLRELAAELIEKVAKQDQEIRSKAEAIERDHRELHRRQVKIDQLTHEMAVLRAGSSPRAASSCTAIREAYLRRRWTPTSRRCRRSSTICN